MFCKKSLIGLLGLFLVFFGTSCFDSASDKVNDPTINPPAAPGAAIVEAEDTRLMLSWDAVPEATAYEVWYFTESFSSITQSGGDITETTHTITDLENGTTYYIWLKAKNAGGESSLGETASGTPVPAPIAPLAPDAPVLTAGDQEINASWSEVENAANYEVWINTTNDTITARQYGTATSGTTCLISGADNGIPLYVWIIAVNSAGNSGFSEVSTATPLGSNALLSNLTIDTGVLEPEFQCDVIEYTVYVAADVEQVVISGTPIDSNAILDENFGQPIVVLPGDNVITLEVTAENDLVVAEYTIRVIRDGDYISTNIGTLKYVPGGTFQRDDIATNTSTVSAFRIGQFEITRSQFLAVMQLDPSRSDRSTGMTDPVQNLSWYHAITFCNKLSIAEGLEPVYSVEGVDFSTITFADVPPSLVEVPDPETPEAELYETWNAATIDWAASGYRLPTEMEWQWAAMGATDSRTKPFAGYDGTNLIGDYTVFGYGIDPRPEGAWESQGTAPVGSKLPNELNIYDLSGNVMEMTTVWNGDYPVGPITDFHGVARDEVPEAYMDDPYRVVRGGNWFEAAYRCAPAARYGRHPYTAYANMGFRVVRR